MNNKTNTELLPCPFCGHEASMTQHESAGGDGRMIWIVGCNSEDCEVSFQGHARKCDAAKDWNARTIDPQLLELCENDEEREILATKNRDGLFTRFLITRAKGDAWPKTPCSKCGHRFHEKECHTSLVSSRGSVACDCAGYDHAAAELRWIPVSERLPKPKYTHLSVQVWISAIFGSERVYDTASFYQGEWTNAEGSLFEDGLQITH